MLLRVFIWKKLNTSMWLSIKSRILQFLICTRETLYASSKYSFTWAKCLYCIYGCSDDLVVISVCVEFLPNTYGCSVQLMTTPLRTGMLVCYAEVIIKLCMCDRARALQRDDTCAIVHNLDSNPPTHLLFQRLTSCCSDHGLLTPVVTHSKHISIHTHYHHYYLQLFLFLICDFFRCFLNDCFLPRTFLRNKGIVFLILEDVLSLMTVTSSFPSIY